MRAPSDPPMCAWHVVHIEEGDDDEHEWEVFHTSQCHVVVSSRGTVSYECWVQYEIEQSGWIAYFDPRKVSPGWYRIRGRTYEQNYGDRGSEWDSESEDSRIRWIPFDNEFDAEKGVDDGDSGVPSTVDDGVGELRS